MNKQKVVVGVLAGIAAGVVLGILFAPDKGTETRKKISLKGSDAMDDLNNKFDEFLGMLKDKFENVKEDANSLANKGASKVEEFKKDAKNIMG